MLLISLLHMQHAAQQNLGKVSMPLHVLICCHEDGDPKCKFENDLNNMLHCSQPRTRKLALLPKLRARKPIAHFSRTRTATSTSPQRHPEIHRLSDEYVDDVWCKSSAQLLQVHVQNLIPERFKGTHAAEADAQESSEL